MTDEGEREQITMTIKPETQQVLDALYPHFLKTQHQLLAAVTEVQYRRIEAGSLDGIGSSMTLPEIDDETADE